MGGAFLNCHLAVESHQICPRNAMDTLYHVEIHCLVDLFLIFDTKHEICGSRFVPS